MGLMFVSVCVKRAEGSERRWLNVNVRLSSLTHYLCPYERGRMTRSKEKLRR